MMRRTIYSKNPNWSSPILDIQWDKSAMVIEAKAGHLTGAQVGNIFKQALTEIMAEINKGKGNATKQDG